MNKTILMLFGLMILTVFSCSKDDVLKDAPSCINNKVEELKEICLGKVIEYDYKGVKVYYFVADSKCRDFPSVWYDEGCNVICSSGGFSGGDNCSELYQNATNQKTIWEK